MMSTNGKNYERERAGIPEESREEFTRDVMKLLNYGGMMQFETVRLHGKEIHLLKPVELDKNDYAEFHYNYFEDDVWERAEYDANSGVLRSGQVGEAQFRNVIAAAYLLQEKYINATCNVKINMKPVIEKVMKSISLMAEEESGSILNDDRAFWWDGTDRVVFSEDMERWIAGLSVQYSRLIKEKSSIRHDQGSFLRELMDVLSEAGLLDKPVYAFQNMFYEFLGHGYDRRYAAAVKLIDKLCQDNGQPEQIRRYLSILANERLRKKCFGF